MREENKAYQRITLILGILAGFMLIITTIISIGNRQNTTISTTEVFYTNPYSVTFENDYQLNFLVGREVATEIYKDIETALLVGKTTNLTASINETSLTTGSVDSDFVYTFNLTTSEQKVYNILIRVDDSYGTRMRLIGIKESNSNTSTLFIHTDNSPIVDNLKNWAISEGFDNPTINYSPILFTLE